MPSSFPYDNCYFDGPNGVPAVIFGCTKDGAAVVATSTSTVSAGTASAAVATGNAVATSAAAGIGSSGDDSSSSASNNGDATTTSLDFSPSATSTGSRTGSTDSGNGGSGSGLSQKSQIILEVALPVGALVVAVLAWWFPCKKRKVSISAEQYPMTQSTSHGFMPELSARTPSNVSSRAFPDRTYDNSHGMLGYGVGSGKLADRYC